MGLETAGVRSLLATLVLITLNGCALFSDGPDFATLSGEAVSETAAVPIDKDARLEVRLLDVTERRTPIAQVSRRADDGLPVPFTLRFDRNRLDPERRYALSAALESQGATHYLTPAPQPVLTFDAPRDEVRLELIPVRP